MNTQNTPKITANNSNSKNHFSKPEKTFKTQQELRNYLIESFSKVKKLSFNLKTINSLK